MGENSSSTRFVTWTARVVAALGLGFVFVPLIWSWVGDLQSETVELYVTGVGVPLLTFAGFLAVYLGFLSQREQNELQKEQLEKQQENFQKDRFESTFFQLLRTQNQIVNDISCGGRKFSASGRNCFKMFFGAFEYSLEKNGEEDADLVDLYEVSESYKEWYENEKSILNHYFNNLTKILSFVDKSGVEDKQFYIDLVIAQMSVPELKLFFYHEAALRDRKGYVQGVYDLLGKYTFFNQIEPERSLIHESHAELHPEALGVQR